MEKDSKPEDISKYDDEIRKVIITSLKVETEKLKNEAKKNCHKLNNITKILSRIMNSYENSKKYIEYYNKKFMELNQKLDSLQVSKNESGLYKYSLSDVQREFEKYSTEYKGEEADEILYYLEEIITTLEGNPDLKTILEILESGMLNLDYDRRIPNIDINTMQDSNNKCNNSDINIQSNNSNINRNLNTPNRDKNNIQNNLPSVNKNKSNLKDGSNNLDDNEDEDSNEEDDNYRKKLPNNERHNCDKSHKKSQIEKDENSNEDDDSSKRLLGHKRHNCDKSSIKSQIEKDEDLLIKEMRKEFSDDNLNKANLRNLFREKFSTKEILIPELVGFNAINFYYSIPNFKNIKLTLDLFTVNELRHDSSLINKLKNIFDHWVVQIDKAQNQLIIAGNFGTGRTGKNFKNLINSLNNFDLRKTHGVLKITIDAYCHEEEMFSKLFDNNLQHNFNDYFISTIFQKFERLEEKRKYFSESKNKAKFNLY